MQTKPEVNIEYCPKCGWLLRSAYIAQELLTTFTDELKLVSLQPSETSGQFRIYVGTEMVFDRKTNGGFADIKVIKRLIRDVACPGKSLGHSEI